MRDVSLSILKMKSLLAVPLKMRNVAWAHDTCTTSRFIHLDVWRFGLKRQYVEKRVLPLLIQAKAELRALAESGVEVSDREKIYMYMRNDELRIKNIQENYLNGKPSGCVPNDTISDLQDRIRDT